MLIHMIQWGEWSRDNKRSHFKTDLGYSDNRGNAGFKTDIGYSGNGGNSSKLDSRFSAT